MALNLTPLLLHSDEVPQQVKSALAAASDAPAGLEKRALLEGAAMALYRSFPLECGEARELVGLAPGFCG